MFFFKTEPKAGNRGSRGQRRPCKWVWNMSGSECLHTHTCLSSIRFNSNIIFRSISYHITIEYRLQLIGHHTMVELQSGVYLSSIEADLIAIINQSAWQLRLNCRLFKCLFVRQLTFNRKCNGGVLLVVLCSGRGNGGSRFRHVCGIPATDAIKQTSSTPPHGNWLEGGGGGASARSPFPFGKGKGQSKHLLDPAKPGD